jgi:hypothetical protein
MIEQMIELYATCGAWLATGSAALGFVALSLMFSLIGRRIGDIEERCRSGSALMMCAAGLLTCVSVLLAGL